MIRCIVSILLLVGQEKESPEIVKELLDVENNTMKPQYSMASEIPLNLFLCNFREDFPEDCGEVPKNIEMLNKWTFDEEALRDTITDLQEHWCSESVKSTMIYEMLKVLRSEYEQQFPDQPIINRQMSSLNRDLKRREYQKLMERQKCSTLEDRIEHYTKKRRIVKAEDDQETNVDE
jgi:tRNA pseudouridine38/39 synthase